MIKNLKKGFGGDYGVKMKPNRLHILCEVEWAPMGAGWPPENTMNLQIVEAVYTVVTGEPGHLDQYPYIDSRLGLAQDPPTWTRFCNQKGKGKILMAQKLTDDKKENSTDLDEDDLTPPPYWIMTRLLVLHQDRRPPYCPIQGQMKFLQQPLLFRQLSRSS